jgi:hypothetical protein
MNALRVDLKKWVSDTDPQSLYDYPEHYIVCISSWFFLETGFSPGLKIPPLTKGDLGVFSQVSNSSCPPFSKGGRM